MLLTFYSNLTSPKSNTDNASHENGLTLLPSLKFGPCMLCSLLHDSFSYSNIGRLVDQLYPELVPEGGNGINMDKYAEV